ncbi:ribonuclease [Bacillus sp. HMF5848]|uniref:YlzJ-like family protein n=1 Tax=Bacillus sp. HMF5848 TaxID=2495421 RepID=UPI000F78E41C|nr:YlzJ-like family protein [Bacillus sp. HMF5848]RSK27087.1 ribonuclease [Bacillus sp. HMF5848]
MIHYSILPIEQVFPTDDAAYAKQQTITVNGVNMIVSSTETFGEYEIVRIISSNPQDYLNVNYAPGTKLSTLPR